MQKLKKVNLFILAILIINILFMTCARQRISPEESVEIFLDVLLKNDSSNIDKIGMTEEDYTEFRNTLEDGIIEGLTGTTLEIDEITNETKTNLKNDIIAGLSKLEYEVIPILRENHNAKVQVNIKGFDMKKIVVMSQENLKEEYESNPSMTEIEAFQESFRIIGKAISKGDISDKYKTVTMNLSKENNIWLIEENDVLAIINGIVEI